VERWKFYEFQLIGNLQLIQEDTDLPGIWSACVGKDLDWLRHDEFESKL
jgi:hypothetical protein